MNNALAMMRKASECLSHFIIYAERRKRDKYAARRRAQQKYGRI